jgi:serine phosphatase RsbU (regulator of sigma subunit)
MNPQDSRIYSLATRLWPQIEEMEQSNRQRAVMAMVTMIFLLPFAIAGLIWLLIASEHGIIFDNPLRFLLLTFVLFLLLIEPFQVRVGLGAEQEILLNSSLAPLVMWAAVLIHGPTGLWAMVLAAAGAALRRYLLLGRYSQHVIWPPLSQFVQEMANSVFAPLVALAIYVAFGGVFPHTGNTVSEWLPALYAVIIGALIPGLLLLLPAIEINRLAGAPSTIGRLARFFAGAVSLPLLMSPFAILLTIITESGRDVALFFTLLGIYLVNRLAHHLSKANERSKLLAREFALLEELGEEIIESPADASTLAVILEEYLPKLFPNERAEIYLFDGGERVWSPFRLSIPSTNRPVEDALWEQMCSSDERHIGVPNVVLPGEKSAYGDALLVKIAPDRTDTEDVEPACVGGIYFMRHGLLGRSVDSLAAVQSLASQISSALYRAKVHAETLAFHKMEQELEFAGNVQASFLPKSVPEPAGWQIAATLEPARQTSGDFYDFMSFGDGRVGILVADVADKGTGAALYMALSRTLIRTFAMQSADQPAEALARANARILGDTDTNQFVTLFYGVIDLNSGIMTYANAGHNPAYLLRAGAEGAHATLKHTGIPLGMFEEMEWQQQEIEILPGDLLLVYSDGVPEAQNADNVEFHDDRLLETGRANIGRPAVDVGAAIVDAVHDFVGNAPQFDDITLVVVVRDSDA